MMETESIPKRPNHSLTSAICRVSHRTWIIVLASLTAGTVFLLQFNSIRQSIMAPKLTWEAAATPPTSTAVTSSKSLVSPYPRTIPDLFIYRRTKKTGSSSMLTALLPALQPLGYTALYYHKYEMKIAVKHEYVKHTSRRLLIAEHNIITREHHPNRHAVIADTVRNGYDQMTAFCRHVRKVKHCLGDAMIACLQSPEALAQIRYRWVGRPEEDADTYIDLPLSSAHPALSNAVLQSVFQNVSLQVAKYNAKNATCPEIPGVRGIYNELYSELDTQIEALKQRMLMVAGYPYYGDKKATKFGTISLDDMLAAAEKAESAKYELMHRGKAKKRGYSSVHKDLIATVQHWTYDQDGNLCIKPRRV